MRTEHSRLPSPQALDALLSTSSTLATCMLLQRFKAFEKKTPEWRSRPWAQDAANPPTRLQGAPEPRGPALHLPGHRKARGSAPLRPGQGSALGGAPAMRAPSASLRQHIAPDLTGAARCCLVALSCTVTSTVSLCPPCRSAERSSSPEVETAHEICTFDRSSLSYGYAAIAGFRPVLLGSGDICLRSIGVHGPCSPAAVEPFYISSS